MREDLDKNTTPEITPESDPGGQRKSYTNRIILALALVLLGMLFFFSYLIFKSKFKSANVEDGLKEQKEQQKEQQKEGAASFTEEEIKAALENPPMPQPIDADKVPENMSVPKAKPLSQEEIKAALENPPMPSPPQ